MIIACVWLSHDVGLPTHFFRFYKMSYNQKKIMIKFLCAFGGYEKGFIPLSLRPHKKGQQALHVYSIANFVASWLEWLQMISNDSKWLQLIY